MSLTSTELTYVQLVASCIYCHIYWLSVTFFKIENIMSYTYKGVDGRRKGGWGGELKCLVE